MARGPALILLLPCLALSQPLPEAYMRASKNYRVPPELLWAVTQTESGANLSGKHRPWPWMLNIKGTGYALTSRKVPVSRQRLFLGKGFLWLPIHTQRLYDCLQPEAARWLRAGWCYRLARHIEKHREHTLPRLARLLSADRWLNPVRPLPPVGGNPWLHGVELKECDVTLPLSERSGHTLVLGTTRVGKTRLAELLTTQDIRRGEVVIVFDPKGDADLLKRLWTEAQRAERGDRFILFHLAYPEISARYNAIGRFGRISEVASRLTGQLSGEGNSAAFREFAWRFVNIIARALVALGQRPDYQLISRHVVNIDALFIDYARIVLPRHNARAWEVVAQEQYLNAEKLYDPILDWQQAIRQKAVVYVGLDALSDAVVAAAVSNSMFANLVSVAGHLYKFGLNDGLLGNSEKPSPINPHCDEFNELMGEEFIQLVNKGGGASIQVTAYTQTLSDIQARIGSAPKAGGINSFTSNTREQVNSSNVPLLETAALIQLPKGQAFALLEGGQLWKIRLLLPIDNKRWTLPYSIQQLIEWMQPRQNGENVE